MLQFKHTHTHTHICIYIYIYICGQTERNTYICAELIPSYMSFKQQIHAIELKQIWLPSENICDCHLTLNRYWYCI